MMAYNEGTFAAIISAERDAERQRRPHLDERGGTGCGCERQCIPDHIEGDVRHHAGYKWQAKERRLWKRLPKNPIAKRRDDNIRLFRAGERCAGDGGLPGPGFRRRDADSPGKQWIISGPGDWSGMDGNIYQLGSAGNVLGEYNGRATTTTRR